MAFEATHALRAGQNVDADAVGDVERQQDRYPPVVDTVINLRETAERWPTGIPLNVVQPTRYQASLGLFEDLELHASRRSANAVNYTHDSSNGEAGRPATELPS